MSMPSVAVDDAIIADGDDDDGRMNDDRLPSWHHGRSVRFCDSFHFSCVIVTLHTFVRLARAALRRACSFTSPISRTMSNINGGMGRGGRSALSSVDFYRRVPKDLTEVR